MIHFKVQTPENYSQTVFFEGDELIAEEGSVEFMILKGLCYGEHIPKYTKPFIKTNWDLNKVITGHPIRLFWLQDGAHFELIKAWQGQLEQTYRTAYDLEFEKYKEELSKQKKVQELRHVRNLIGRDLESVLDLDTLIKIQKLVKEML